MIVRDARSADVSAVHRLIGQLVDAPDEGEFRARFERVTASDGHRIIVAETKPSSRRSSSTAMRAAAVSATPSCARPRLGR
jgi:hypothetical protein